MVSSCRVTPLMDSATPVGKKHFAVGASTLLGRLDAERIEALRQGMNGLVGRENPLPVGERQRDFLKVMGHHEIL